VKLKEAKGKPSTAGTRTDREAACRRRAGWEQRSPKAIKVHEVESGGARGKRRHLPGETLSLREERESAEAVVAKMPLEREAERRAEEPRSRAIEGTGSETERSYISRRSVEETTSPATQMFAGR